MRLVMARGSAFRPTFPSSMISAGLILARRSRKSVSRDLSPKIPMKFTSCIARGLPLSISNNGLDRSLQLRIREHKQ